MKDFNEFWGLAVKLNFKALFWDESVNGFVHLFRYLFVGGVGFLVDAGAVMLFEYLLTPALGDRAYLVAACIGFTVSLAINYILTKVFVFRGNRSAAGRLAEIVFFAIIGVTGLGLTELLMWIGVERFGFSTILSKVIAAAIVLFWNYALKKLVLYRRPSKG